MKLPINIFLSLILFSHISLGNPQNDSLYCDIDPGPFQVGEYLEYDVYYNWGALWLKAGKATFEVKEDKIDGKDVFHFDTRGRTRRSYDWFFKVRDRYETYIDQQTLRPVRFVRDINEGGYTKKVIYNYVSDTTVVLEEYRRRGKLERSGDTLNISPCTQDLVSSVYYVRGLNYEGLEVNDTIPVDLLLDAQMYEVHARYLGRETIDTDLGKFNCIKFSPLLIEGDIFRSGEGVTVWATDDENKIPIYVEAELAVGKVRAYLKKFKNIKTPLRNY